MKKIFLSQRSKGRKVSALVDDDMYEFINQWRWTASRSGGRYYAIRIVKENGKNRMIAMHRLLSGNTSKLYTDHINGDSLDNRVSNLRICSHKQNIRNSARRKGKYKGIYYNSKRKCYQSYITIDGKHKYLGCSATDMAAAIKYNEAAIKYFGEYAKINYIPSPEENSKIKFE